ncbi:hypothetical protein MH116_13625 [Bacillus pumilus]|uniref:3-alpha domain-containing protein n=1 Tax=Bacillus pumilus TaxID=1408 RepID=UPI00049F67A2|nr:3-alpha domain-containing protein [Bacillus pumilus]MCY7618897.1 hypothetical protein [Bacillus pumilus]
MAKEIYLLQNLAKISNSKRYLPINLIFFLEKALHHITVHEVNEVKYRQTSPERLKAVLAVDALADVVRKSLEKRIQHI